jgi:hypothetical protein
MLPALPLRVMLCKPSYASRVQLSVNRPPGKAGLLLVDEETAAGSRAAAYLAAAPNIIFLSSNAAGRRSAGCPRRHPAESRGSYR